MPSFNVDGEQVKVTMTEIVQFFMYLSVAINLLMMKINTSDILSSNIAQSAIGALFAVLGPGWLGATVFNAPQNLKLYKTILDKQFHTLASHCLSCHSGNDRYLANCNSLHYGADCHEYGYSTNVFHCNGPNA